MTNIITSVDQAVSILKEGSLVAIPTETVYGLAADAQNEQAVGKVFSLKNRPLNHPLILHLSTEFDLSTLVTYISEDAKALMSRFWPGPLTLVFERNPNTVSDSVTGGKSTVAIRCPDHPLTQELLRKLKKPLVAPSANPFGKISPTMAQHVVEGFGNEALTILDGGRCPLGIESTIVAVTRKEGFQLLRPGALSLECLKEVIDSFIEGHSMIRVSGGLKHHYQPKKKLFAFSTHKELVASYVQADKPVYVLSFTKEHFFQTKYFYQLPRRSNEFAYELYFQLHVADQSDAQCIYIELPPEDECWSAIRDRILKASK